MASPVQSTANSATSTPSGAGTLSVTATLTGVVSGNRIVVAVGIHVQGISGLDNISGAGVTDSQVNTYTAIPGVNGVGHIGCTIGIFETLATASGSLTVTFSFTASLTSSGSATFIRALTIAEYSTLGSATIPTSSSAEALLFGGGGSSPYGLNITDSHSATVTTTFSGSASTGGPGTDSAVAVGDLLQSGTDNLFAAAISSATVNTPTASAYTFALEQSTAIGGFTLYFWDAGIAAPTARGNIDYDQLQVAVRHGSGNKVQMSDGSGAAGNIPIFAADGSLTDGGSAPASGTVTSVTASSPLASSGGATPAISLSSAVPVAKGGTHADLSATGGAHQVLQQSSTGADITVGQLAESDLSTTDITTNNVSSSKHGFTPKSPADATQFLNGAATPAFAAVKDSDLSTSDITTNNVSTSKHGFAPKLPNDATQYLDGTGAYSTPAGGGGGGGSSFPFTVVQEGAAQSGGGAPTSLTITFQQTTASSGNTVWVVLSSDGSQTWTTPTGWTVDINQTQATYARLTVMHKTTASDTSVTVSFSGGASFAAWYFELSGARTFDQSSHAGATIPAAQLLGMPAITPTANSLVFGFAASLHNGAIYHPIITPSLSPAWRQVAVDAALGGGGRYLIGHVSTVAATNVSTTPPVISFPGVTIYSGGGIAYATFSIL
jgi:hypothetical protein